MPEGFEFMEEASKRVDAWPEWKKALAGISHREKNVEDINKQKCQCDMRTKLVGDGCDICNQELALDHARDEIAELQYELAICMDALRQIMVEYQKYSRDYVMSGIARNALDKVRK